VRENGVDFDMADSERMFHAFQRLHNSTDFPGKEIVLSTVQRIISRYGGRTWAEGGVESGAL